MHDVPPSMMRVRILKHGMLLLSSRYSHVLFETAYGQDDAQNEDFPEKKSASARSIFMMLRFGRQRNPWVCVFVSHVEPLHLRRQRRRKIQRMARNHIFVRIPSDVSKHASRVSCLRALRSTSVQMSFDHMLYDGRIVWQDISDHSTTHEVWLQQICRT